MNECTHDWETVGETSFSGDTWSQWAKVLYCKNCKRYAARTTHFFDYRRRGFSEVQSLQQEETAARQKLIADHKAKVAAG